MEALQRRHLVQLLTARRPPAPRSFGTVVRGPASLCPAVLSVPRGETVPVRCCVHVARGRGGDAVITASAVTQFSSSHLCAGQEAASWAGDRASVSTSGPQPGFRALSAPHGTVSR